MKEKKEVRISLADLEKEKLESGEILKIQGGDPTKGTCTCLKDSITWDSKNGTSPIALT
ncbi:MAG: hypothetical protein KAW12_22480 [Candidatus Aminicenantes bacterium]|nr:hypothetical protein [Candidatus Aminicenantes bacterium]